MAFSDPQSVTIDTVPISLPRISSNDTRSVYQNADGDHRLTISHQASGNRKRRMVRIDKTVVAADPLTSVNQSMGLGVYLVIDEPAFGFADADIHDVVAGLIAWATEANVLDVCESQH